MKRRLFKICHWKCLKNSFSISFNVDCTELIGVYFSFLKYHVVVRVWYK